MSGFLLIKRGATGHWTHRQDTGYKQHSVEEMKKKEEKGKKVNSKEEKKLKKGKRKFLLKMALERHGLT